MTGWIRPLCAVAAVVVCDGPTIAAEPTADAPWSLTIEGAVSEPVRKRIVDVLAARQKQLRAFWPERIAAERPIRIELFGTLDAYRAAVSRRGAPIDNPACYFAADGVIVLGFDGQRFDGSLRRTREQADRLRNELQKAERILSDQLRADDARFALNGTPREQRKQLTADRRRKFDVEAARMQKEIDKADAENRQTLVDATARLADAAAHELFHAYVDSRVYPPERGGLPAWLNEGLAQIVEHASATAAIGRPLKPDAELARRWKAEQSRGEAVDVHALLSADAVKFLIHDANPPAEAGKYYLAAWAVAQSLLNDGKLAPGPELDRFLSDYRGDPFSAFQRWTAQSLGEWERTHAK